MAFVLNDRVLEESTSTGTGPLTLIGAPSGYQSFLVGIGGNNTTYYAAFNTVANEWELGLGTLNAGATTLTRTTIYSSSNANNAVNFTAGTKNVFVTLPSSQTMVASNVAITGGTINGTSVGASTPSTGAFTTLSASGTVSGTGFSNYVTAFLSSPTAIGNTVPNIGAFTNLSSSGTVSGTGFSNYLASPPAIGGSTPAAGTFTTLSDSIGNVRDIPQNSRTTAYVLTNTDDGKHISITTGGVTVPAGVFSIGNVITIFNNSSSNQTITQGASVTLRFAGTTSTGNRTLLPYGLATILCVASNTFTITGAGLT